MAVNATSISKDITPAKEIFQKLKKKTNNSERLYVIYLMLDHLRVEINTRDDSSVFLQTDTEYSTYGASKQQGSQII